MQSSDHDDISAPSASSASNLAGTNTQSISQSINVPSKKVTSLNLNKTLKPAVKPTNAGVIVLGRGRGKVPSKISAPKPVNLPSLKKSNDGFDQLVQIVPAGTQGWKTDQAANQSNSQSISQPSPILRGTPSPQPGGQSGGVAWQQPPPRARAGVVSKDEFPSLNDTSSGASTSQSIAPAASPSPSAAAAALQRSYQSRNDALSNNTSSNDHSNEPATKPSKFDASNDQSNDRAYRRPDYQSNAWASDDEGEMDYSQPIVFADGSSVSSDTSMLHQSHAQPAESVMPPREAWGTSSQSTNQSLNQSDVDVLNQDAYMKQRAAQRRAERENEEKRLEAEREARARARLAEIERKIAAKQSIPSSPAGEPINQFDRDDQDRDFHAERLDREYEHTSKHDDFESRVLARPSHTIRHIIADDQSFEPKQVLQRPKENAQGVSSALSSLSLSGSNEVLKKQKQISISLKLNKAEEPVAEVVPPTTHLHLLQSNASRNASKPWRDLETPSADTSNRTLYEPPAAKASPKVTAKAEPTVDMQGQSGVPLITPRGGLQQASPSASQPSRLTGRKEVGARMWDDAPHFTSSGIPMIAPGLPMPVLGLAPQSSSSPSANTSKAQTLSSNDPVLSDRREDTILAGGVSPLHRETSTSLLSSASPSRVFGNASSTSSLDSRLNKAQDPIGFSSGRHLPTPIGPIGPSSLHASSVPLDANASMARAIARAPGTVNRDPTLSAPPAQQQQTQQQQHQPHHQSQQHQQQQQQPQDSEMDDNQLVPIPPQIQLLMQTYNMPMHSPFITVAQLNKLHAWQAQLLQGRTQSAANNWPNASDAQNRPPARTNDVMDALAEQAPHPAVLAHLAPQINQLHNLSQQLGQITQAQLQQLNPQQLAVLQQLHSQYRQLQEYIHQQVATSQRQQQAQQAQQQAQQQQQQQQHNPQQQNFQQQQQQQHVQHPNQQQQQNQPLNQQLNQHMNQHQQQQAQQNQQQPKPLVNANAAPHAQQAPASTQSRAPPAPIGTRAPASAGAAAPTSKPAATSTPAPPVATPAAAVAAPAPAPAKPTNWAAAVIAGPSKIAAAAAAVPPTAVSAPPAAVVPAPAVAAVVPPPQPTPAPAVSSSIIRITNPHLTKQQQPNTAPPSTESKEIMTRIKPTTSINIITPITPLPAGTPVVKSDSKDRRGRGERRGRGTRGGQKNRENKAKDGADASPDTGSSPVLTSASPPVVGSEPATSPAAGTSRPPRVSRPRRQKPKETENGDASASASSPSSAPGKSSDAKSSDAATKPARSRPRSHRAKKEDTTTSPA